LSIKISQGSVESRLRGGTSKLHIYFIKRWKHIRYKY